MYKHVGVLSVGLIREYGHEVASVAVLTPYKAQLALLRSSFARQHSKSALANVEFATVDGFQVRCLITTYLQFMT